LVTTADTSGILQLQTASTAALTIDASQNVGIGTTSPTALTSNKALTINSPTGFGSLLDLKTNETLNLRVFSNASSSGLSVKTATPLVFDTNDLERMRIDSSGNVGIGNASPTATLDTYIGSGPTSFGTFANSVRINGGNTSGKYVSLTFGGYGSNAPAAISYAVTTGTGNTSGDLIFGTRSVTTDTLPTERMRINSSGYLQCAGVYNQTNPNAANVFVGTAGDLYRSTSSLKYKKNIENSVHGLTDLLKLRSVTYQSSNPDNGEQVFGGFIAEEVHDAGLNEFVQYAENGSPDALAYGNMVALCVKSIQELKAELDELKAKVNA
jgi:hypothetical protein